jgi:hypothetical protein
MKTLYSIISAFLFSTLVFGQSSVEIKGQDNINYASDTVTISGSGINISKIFYVKNTGTTTQFFWARKIIIMSSPDFIIQLCDENLCMDTQGQFWISQYEKTIQTGDSLLFKPQMTLSGVSGSAEVRYYALDGDNNKIDSMTVMFNSTLSTDKNEQTDFNIYPNPAQDYVNIKSEGLKNGGMVVFLDALGKEVKRSSVKGINTKLSVSDLKRGVYFVNINGNNGMKSNVQRLIIQ